MMTPRTARLISMFLGCLLVVGLLPPVTPLQAEPLGPTMAELAPQQFEQAVRLAGTIRLGTVGEPGVIVELVERRRLFSGVFSERIVQRAFTNAQGAYTLNATISTLALNSYFLRPRKGVFEFQPATRPVTASATGQDATMLRPPIIIQGGYSPFGLPQDSCPQPMLGGGSYNPGGCGDVEFANLLTALRNAGWNVRTVMMNSSAFGTPTVTGFNTTHERALRLQINQARQATGASKVIIFAHSTGGVVAQRYIEGTSYQRDVAHLFTFGSQHLGNPVEQTAKIWFNELMPQIAREALGNNPLTNTLVGVLLDPLLRAIRASVGDLVNYLCTETAAQYRLFVPLLIDVTVRVPGPNQRVLCETSPAGMANFNLAFRPRSDVFYHLVHGRNVPNDHTVDTSLPRQPCEAIPVVRSTQKTGRSRGSNPDQSHPP
ncbi:MAG: esterase/lipase family protein [Oscillochloridaceae bacterium umkhey_bin13]